jgi:hypothetical protein
VSTIQRRYHGESHPNVHANHKSDHFVDITLYNQAQSQINDDLVSSFPDLSLGKLTTSLSEKARGIDIL